jgi:GrpB-like predicted nucleotidyltransferase (UPF0157 family)
MLIESYRKSWIDEFNALKKVLAETLLPLPVGIDHVGSTSVPGLAAKPIIDIDLVFDKRVAFAAIESRLATIGYRHTGNQGIPGREVFKRGHATGKHPLLDSIPHHLYGCLIDSAELQRHRLFRDYLIAHEEARVHYQQLKYALALEAHQDRKRYAQLKELKATAFINGVIEKARNGWS